MFIIKLSQHVSGIIMPIIRRTIVCTPAYGVLHCNKRLQLQFTVQNTICGSAHYCSPDDGHNDARNMLR